MSLREYPSYRDSGVEWLGTVPEHWQVYRLKTQMTLCTEKTDQRVKPVALENIESWSGRFIATDTEFEGEGVAFKGGDLLFGKLRPYLAKVYLAENSGEAIGDFHVLRPNSLLHGRYAQYQMLNQSFIEVIDGSTFGSKMPRANWESLGGMPFAIPPLAEQMAITAFLDCEISKIDLLISKQEKLISLLSEKRQVTISQAVTQGLNLGVESRDTREDWSGSVPTHWRLPPMYLRYSSELGKMLDASRITGRHLIPYLRNIDVQWDAIDYSDLPTMDIEPKEFERYTIRDGDLLVCEGGDVGRAAVVVHPGGVVGYQKALHRLRALSEDEHPRYMYYTFAWASKAGLFAGEGQSTIAHLTGEQLRKYRFPKPQLSEQRAIAAFLDAETSRLAALKVETFRAIALLRERRSALIAAAVTGQIDVRDSAPTFVALEELAA